jgi:RND family efflux transporter MFP subunit
MNDPARVLNELRIDRNARAPKRRARWPWLIGLAVVLVGGWFALGALRPVTVELATARSAAESGPLSVLDASGYVTPRRIATVSSKITGKVLEVLIEEGQRVVADEVLARLDDTDANAQLALSQAQLAAARAQLGEVQAQLRLAETTLLRQRELKSQRLASQAALDQAETEVAALRARLGTVQRNVGVSEQALALARIGLDNTVVRAPFAGVVIAKAAQQGEMISPISAGGGFTRTGIGTIVDMDSLEVQVDVNEAYIGRVQPGMAVEAVLNAYPDWRIPAAVIAIIPTADRSKATVKVRIALHSKDARIVPDMGVRVSFLEERAADAPPRQGVWIPSRALQGRGGESAVFVLEDGRARRVAVEVGEVRDADRLITRGLREGQGVLLSPPDGLRDGARVAVKGR